MDERKVAKTERNSSSLRLSVFAFTLSALFLAPSLQAQELPKPEFLQLDGKWVVQLHLPDGNIDSLSPSFLLPVFVGEKATSSRQPSILGSYTWENHHLRFFPNFSFRPGQVYRTRYLDGSWTVFEIPKVTDAISPQLLHIYPSTDTLPTNLLKMYLHFSQPMRQGIAYEQLIFLDGAGKEQSLPFLQLQPELWDESGTILTLWLDPGRVKRDLGPNQAWGAPLEAGESYTLRVKTSWTNLKGDILNGMREKTFTVGLDDRRKPDPHLWTIQPPTAKTREPLNLFFGEGMDWQLGNKVFQVVDEKGQLVLGEGTMRESETTWEFRPDAPWQSGKYFLHIESRFEDLAGNNLNRLFDRDLEVETTPPSEQKTYVLDFLIK